MALVYHTIKYPPPPLFWIHNPFIFLLKDKGNISVWNTSILKEVGWSQTLQGSNSEEWGSQNFVKQGLNM